MRKLLLILLVLLGTGCKKDRIDPREKILGRWEEFYVGNGEHRPPIDPPIAYREFLPDSVVIDHNYVDNTTLKRKYWIDSQLHIGIRRSDGYVFSLDYEYRFDGDTLRLDWVNVNPIFSVVKFRRVN